MSAQEIVQTLGLQPHPEGGHFRETWRDDAGDADTRPSGTAIFYLLAEGETSHWHRVDACEIWHWYGGSSLRLSTSADGKAIQTRLLGGDITGQELPQLVVPKHHWQSAQSLGNWTLVGCTVSPGFEFAGFEMAPTGWNPGE